MSIFLEPPYRHHRGRAASESVTAAAFACQQLKPRRPVPSDLHLVAKRLVFTTPLSSYCLSENFMGSLLEDL
jgi:hypothetical protein